jgi:hypothetical protein
MSLWLLVSGVFTAIVIQYSFRRGRLLIYPAYDDVVYMLDGLRRLDTVYQSGPLAFFSNWMHDPPHAPLSTLLAFLSFLTLGVHDWAPYAANGVFVLTMVAFTDRLMKGTSTLCRMAAIIFVLSTPVAAEAVHEFRPDIASALFTAIAIIALLDGRLIGSGWTRPVVAGIFFGLALFSKMTVFPLTITVSMFALGVAIARDRLIAPFGWQPVIRVAGLFLLPAVLIAGPQYGIGFKQILKYVYDAQFGRYADVWTFKATMREHVMFFLNGQGARVMLGSHRYIVLAIFVLGGVYLGLTRRRDQILNSLAYAAVILVAYLIPTLNWQKTRFFGVVFHWSLIFSALLILRHLIRVERDRLSPIPWASTLMVFVCIVGIFLFQWPSFQSAEEIAHSDKRNQIDDQIIAAILDHKGRAASTAMLTTIGYVNPFLLNYLTLKRRQPISFSDLAFSRDPEEHRRSWPDVDFVIAAERDSSESAPYVPSYAIQNELLSTLHSSPDFVQVAAVPTLNDKCFYVFQNVRRIPLRDSRPPQSCAEVNAEQGAPLTGRGFSSTNIRDEPAHK